MLIEGFIVLWLHAFCLIPTTGRKSITKMGIGRIIVLVILNGVRQNITLNTEKNMGWRVTAP